MLQLLKIPMATISFIFKHCKNLIRCEIDILISMEFNNYEKLEVFRSTLNDIETNHHFHRLCDSTIILRRTDYKRNPRLLDKSLLLLLLSNLWIQLYLIIVDA